MIIQRQLDAQRILDRFEPLESSVEDLCEMADERRKQRKLSEAQLLCDEGVNAARELDDVMAEAVCLLHQWAMHYVAQKFPEAIEDASRSKRLFEDLGEGYAEINASIALGMSYEAQGIFLKSRGLDKKSATSLQSAVPRIITTRLLSSSMPPGVGHPLAEDPGKPISIKNSWTN